MAQYGKHGSRNMGMGRSAKHAAKNALRSHSGDGKFGTVDTHSRRFDLFCDWMKTQLGITDLRKITPEHLLSYVAHLKQLMLDGKIAVSTATNRVSTCNVVFKIMRGDTRIRVDNIGELLGEKRCYIRGKVPAGMCLDDVMSLQQRLIDSGFTRVAAIVRLARTCGMRLRETILADLPRLRREAVLLGKVNIQNGTKGGRGGEFAPRWIPVTEALQAAINYAIEVSPKSSRNLLSPTETYKCFLHGPVGKARKELHWKGIKGFHELRVSYACSRYERLTGHPAPVILKRKNLSPEERAADQDARKIISRELGHERPEITNSYLGSNSK